MNFKEKISKVAEHLADKAIHKDTPFNESIDAFKELRAYYAAIAKEKPEEADDKNSIEGFQRSIQAAQENINGGKSVRGGRHHS